jgi:hypothetical protein
MRRPLPIPAPINRHRRPHRQPHDALDLPAVRHPTVILTPRGFLCVSDQIRARNEVMMAALDPAHPEEKLLRAIRIDA